MSFRTGLVVLLALVSGGSAAIGINKYTLHNQEPSSNLVETVAIVVASTEIPRTGTLLTQDMVKTWEYPKDRVPSGAITKVEDVLDRAIVTPLVKDEPLLEGKLAAKGSGRGMAWKIPKGMRGFAITVPNLASGVAGFILPGDRVDVLLTVTSNGNDETGGSSTAALLQNVEILAVDQRVDAPVDNRFDVKELRSVTLLVTQEQAAKLTLGQSKGTLYLTLRHPDDKESATAAPTTLADLRLFQEKPKVKEPSKAAEPVPVKEREPIMIRTLHGIADNAVYLVPAR